MEADTNSVHWVGPHFVGNCQRHLSTVQANLAAGRQADPVPLATLVEPTAQYGLRHDPQHLAQYTAMLYQQHAAQILAQHRGQPIPPNEVQHLQPPPQYPGINPFPTNTRPQGQIMGATIHHRGPNGIQHQQLPPHNGHMMFHQERLRASAPPNATVMSVTPMQLTPAMVTPTPSPVVHRQGNHPPTGLRAAPGHLGASGFAGATNHPPLQAPFSQQEPVLGVSGSLFELMSYLDTTSKGERPFEWSAVQQMVERHRATPMRRRATPEVITLSESQPPDVEVIEPEPSALAAADSLLSLATEPRVHSEPIRIRSVQDLRGPPQKVPWDLSLRTAATNRDPRFAARR
jgi:hypothetical protein